MIISTWPIRASVIKASAVFGLLHSFVTPGRPGRGSSEGATAGLKDGRKNHEPQSCTDRDFTVFLSMTERLDVQYA